MRVTCQFHVTFLDLAVLMIFGGNRDSVVSIAIRYKMDRPGFEFRQGQDVFSSLLTRTEINSRKVRLLAIQLPDPAAGPRKFY